jgi:hypothetical protein
MLRSLRLAAVGAVLILSSGLTACATAAKPSAGTQNSVPSASQAAISNAIDVANAPFVGSLKSKKYYPAACHTVKLIKAGDQVGFASIDDAEKAGFKKDMYSTDCRY